MHSALLCVQRGKHKMWKYGFGLLLLALLPCQLVAVNIRCNQSERIRQDHIHYCCKHPDGHNDITELCAKETGFKLPSPQEEAPEDITVEQAIAGTCWARCVFTKYNFLKNNSLDMDAVRKHYKEVHALDPEYEREMISAFDHCHDKSIEYTTNFMSSGMFKGMSSESYCDPRGSVILACVIHKFFHNCPKDRWAHTQECNDTLAFASKCKNSLSTM